MITNCEICQMAFKCRTNKNRHVLRVHNGVTYKCKKCEKTYYTEVKYLGFFHVVIKVITYKSRGQYSMAIRVMKFSNGGYKIRKIFKSLVYFLKWSPIFDTSPLTQFSKFNKYVDSEAKIFLIFYPPFEISMTRIAIFLI